MTQPLRFEGAVTAVKQSVGGEYGGGSLQLTLTVKEPKKPFRPSPPYECVTRGEKPAWKPRPTLPAQKKNETDEAYQKRTEASRAALTTYDASIANYRRALDEYQDAWKRYTAELQDYMWLTGSAGIVGAKSVMVSLEPMNRGFSEMEDLLLPPPALTPDPSPDAAGEGGDNDDVPELKPDYSAAAEGVLVAFSPEKDTQWPVEGDDPPCPRCSHPLKSSHDDDDLFGGCSALLEEGGEELCPCDVRLVAA